MHASAGATYFNVRDYNDELGRAGVAPVRGDGGGDDAPGIQHILDHVMPPGGGVLYLPPGVYAVSRLRVEKPVTVLGSGWARAPHQVDEAITTLKARDPDGDVLTVGRADPADGESPLQGVRIAGLGFSTSPFPRTGGAYVNFRASCADCTLQDFYLNAAFIGVAVSGSSITVADGWINVTGYHYAGKDSACAGVHLRADPSIDFPGMPRVGYAQYLRGLNVVGWTRQAVASGIRVSATQDARISNCACLGHRWNMLVTGGSSIAVENSFLDSGDTGLLIHARDGSVTRSHWANTWIGNHDSYGVQVVPSLIRGAYPSVSDLDFSGCRIVLNGARAGADGFRAEDGFNIRVVNSTICNNHRVGLAFQGKAPSVPGDPGSPRLPALENLTILGNHIGQMRDPELGPPYQLAGNQVGLWLKSTANTIVANNNLLGNLQADFAPGDNANHVMANNLRP
jgi:hypothetical protein